LDPDSDPVTIDGALAQDPTLAPLVAASRGTRLPGAADGSELVVRAIVGQQVSVAARATLGQITAKLARRLEAPDGPTHTFSIAATGRRRFAAWGVTVRLRFDAGAA
jgi:AraC family transcriptional regulator, regulatory protein of adaptative response / DNA-3-methyladenine glycosylase II